MQKIYLSKDLPPLNQVLVWYQKKSEIKSRSLPTKLGLGLLTEKGTSKGTTKEHHHEEVTIFGVFLIQSQRFLFCDSICDF